MSKLLTVRQVLNRIEKIGMQDKNRVLTCGATHIAQDADGEYYAFRGEPRKDLVPSEWVAGNGKDNRCMLYCGQGDKPKDHTVCVWELP